MATRRLTAAGVLVGVMATRAGVAASEAHALRLLAPLASAVPAWEDADDQTIYKVVVNQEEQYSIWPAHRDLPLGWTEVGKSGLRQECLDYIKEVWTDMRPLALRKQMEAMEKQAAGEQPAAVSQPAQSSGAQIGEQEESDEGAGTSDEGDDSDTDESEATDADDVADEEESESIEEDEDVERR